MSTPFTIVYVPNSRKQYVKIMQKKYDDIIGSFLRNVNDMRNDIYFDTIRMSMFYVRK